MLVNNNNDFQYFILCNQKLVRGCLTPYEFLVQLNVQYKYMMKCTC